MSCLYHYCSNEKCFSILKGKTIRLSDIEKSNDYMELSLFFPGILDAIDDLYRKKPFRFKYNNKFDSDAFFELTRDSFDYWERRFSDGSYTNFVICFSETPDSLSQWRGYADNGKGCCIGFSKDVLQDYCEANDSILRMEKVDYLSPKQISDRIKSSAKECIDELRTLREWIIDNMTKNDDDPDTDGLLGFNFNGMLSSVFIDSLCIKSKAFKEENEWRIFLKNPAYKQPDWVCKNRNTKMMGPRGFSETINYLNDKIDFQITDNDIIPFCPIKFDEFSSNPVLELWTGPKSIIRERDIELFLKQNGFIATKPFHSRITYC